MRFALKIDVSIPPDMPEKDKGLLREKENQRARELVDSGNMLHIWRTVGRVANFSIWQADSLEHLHEILLSMPMFPYMKIEVTPIINHPVTEYIASSQK